MGRVLAPLLLLLALPGLAFAYASPGAPDGYVTDFADILNEETEATLESEIAAFTASTTIEIGVATVPSLDGDDIAVFANELFREWGIGKKDADNGVLLLVAPNERELRIEVGYGLEGALTDLQAGYIIDEIITPRFKEGDFDGGVADGVHAVMRVTEGEPFAVTSADDLLWFFSNPESIFVIGMILIQFLGAMLARSRSWWLGGFIGGVAGVVIGIIFGFLYAGIIALAALVPLGLLLDYWISSTYEKYKGTGQHMPWYIGGGSSGGGFGGGSSGGSFGGGSSGGGGASGSW